MKNKFTLVRHDAYVFGELQAFEFKVQPYPLHSRMLHDEVFRLGGTIMDWDSCAKAATQINGSLIPLRDVNFTGVYLLDGRQVFLPSKEFSLFAQSANKVDPNLVLNLATNDEQ